MLCKICKREFKCSSKLEYHCKNREYCFCTTCFVQSARTYKSFYEISSICEIDKINLKKIYILESLIER